MSDGVRPVTIRDCAIGGPELVVMAGPCAIESREQILGAAQFFVRLAGHGELNLVAFRRQWRQLGWTGLGDGRRLRRTLQQRFLAPDRCQGEQPDR